MVGVSVCTILTTADLVQCPIYRELVLPLGVQPPNIINVLSVNAVNVKSRQ